MTTIDDILEYVKERNEQEAGLTPIYEIMVFENPDKEQVYPTGKRSGFPALGATNTAGFYHDIHDAYDTVINNACDLWETVYNAAFILCRFPGLYQAVCDFSRMYFVYNKETGKYEQNEEPAIFSRIAY